LTGQVGRDVKASWTGAAMRKEIESLRPKPGPKPDIGLSFVYPTGMATFVVNQSRAIIRQPKFGMVLWNLRERTRDPLPVPTQLGDYIRPGEGWGPSALTSIAGVASRIKAGDQLFGVASVRCPDCIKTREYWVFAEHGTGGWYAEVEDNKRPNIVAIGRALPELDVTKMLDELVPTVRRVPIRNWPVP